MDSHDIIGWSKIPPDGDSSFICSCGQKAPLSEWGAHKDGPPKYPELARRIARAICMEDDPDCYAQELVITQPGEKPESKPLWEWHIPRAFAVLYAIREPTEAMRAAARNRIWEFLSDYADSHPDPKGEHPESAERVAADVWREMSAAALKE
jgi:hypothetical protein